MTVLINLILRILTYGFLSATGYFAINTGIVPLVAWLGIIGLWLYRSIVTIPVIHYGDYRVFGKRIGQTVLEGTHWREWWYTVHLYSSEVRLSSVSESFPTEDKVQTIVEGPVQYIPDKELVSVVYSSLSEEAITVGLNSFIKKEIGIVAGRYSYQDFFKKRREIGQLINCLLRMRNPPHLDVSALTWVDDRLGDEHSINPILEKCSPDGTVQSSWITADREVPTEKVLNFYEIFSHQIRLLLENEAGFKVRSRVEEEYGIDVKVFNLANVDYTEKMAAIMEREQQAAIEVTARQKKSDATLALTGNIRKRFKTVPQNEALRAAMAVHGLTNHYSFEGGGNVIPIISPPAGGQNTGGSSDGS